MSATLKGGKELAEFLKAFPDRLQKNAVRAGLTAAAAVVRDQARANARKESGLMAKAIKSSRPVNNSDGSASIKIRLRGKHAFLGVFMEYGTAAHIIKPGDSGVSARILNRRARSEGITSDTKTGAMKIGNNFVTGAILHPGTRAHPFLRPALDMKADEAVQAFGVRIRDYIQGKTGFTGPTLDLADAA